jgi:hypothetical protein
MVPPDFKVVAGPAANENTKRRYAERGIEK